MPNLIIDIRHCYLQYNGNSLRQPNKINQVQEGEHTLSDTLEETQNEVMKAGAFAAALKRNNKEIRDDRADSICDIAETKYRRAVEDMRQQLKDMKREQDNMLDMSPTTTHSLVMASDFKSDEFVNTDIELGIKIRNLEIKLEIAEARHTHLFGGAA